MTAILTFGPLVGGGLVLGYRCPARCWHCLYGFGPHRRDGAPDSERLERLLDRFAEVAPRSRFHIGGGEPFLDLELLQAAVTGMRERGLVLDYVETNAWWARGRDVTCETLAGLKGAMFNKVALVDQAWYDCGSPAHA